jgi:hypothetical protein
MGFALPTDMDAAGRSVGARGVDWRQVWEKGSADVFAGKTGEQFGVGYLQGVTPQRWGASAVVRGQVRKDVAVQVIGAAGAAQAALLSAVWKRGDRVELAGTTGWNAGSGIFAVSARVRGDSWSLRASETVGRLQLRPATSLVGEQHVAERAGVNVQVEKQFAAWLRGDASRVAYAKDAEMGLPDGARLHEAGLTAHVGEAQAGVRVLQSVDGANEARGVAALARWSRGVWSVETMVAESWRDGGRSESVMGSGSRQFASRVKVTGGVDVADGAPSLVAGADVLGRWGSVGVNERMVYVPFGGNAGFRKVLELRVRLHPKGVETSVSTLVGGGLAWTYSALAEHFVETAAGGAAETGVRVLNVDLPKYVVRGRVIDEAGMPVMAAAVRVGDETVWTGADGEWEVRERKAVELMVRVSVEEFLTSRHYVAAEEARLVTPAVEDEALPVVLRVRECRGCVAGVQGHGPSAVEGPVAASLRQPVAARESDGDLVSAVKEMWGPVKRGVRVAWRGDLR